MRFESSIIGREGMRDPTSAIHRNPDGSIDFDFYRRRAIGERRLARRIWLKRKLDLCVRLGIAAIRGIRQIAYGRTAPIGRCCSAAERAACCA